MKKAWKLSELESVPLSRAFQEPGRWPGERRWPLQALVAAGLFLLVVGAFSFNYPLAGTVQRSLRYYLGSAESDWTPQLQRMVEAGLWQDSADRLADLPTGKPAWSPAAPLTLPVSGRVTREFGWDVVPVDGSRRLHGGIDIQAEAGAPVRAALAGKVSRVARVGDQGRLVELDHGQGLRTVYQHLEEVLVEEGEAVREGQLLGKLGGKDAYLHFEVRHNGEPVNPMPYLGQGGQRI